MIAIINRKKYDTATATAIADNEFQDGSNRLAHGRATTLYRTPNGGYFSFDETCWQGEHDSINPLSLDQAIDLWEGLPYHTVSFEESFPGVEVTEA